MAMTASLRTMKSEGLLKQIAGALVLAIVIYVGGYSLDQYLRNRRGRFGFLRPEANQQVATDADRSGDGHRYGHSDLDGASHWSVPRVRAM
jgi:hypothetical protein